MSAVGCFWTPDDDGRLAVVAGVAALDARRRSRRWRPACSKIGWPLRTATTVSRRSSSRLVRPTLRIRYSRPCWSTKPPPVLVPKRVTACSIWSGVTSSACMAAMFGVTRYWRTSPPIGITCATPGNARSCGRSTKSATSRTLHRRHAAVAGHRDQHDLAHDRGDRPHLRTDRRAASCSRMSARRSETS